MRRPYDGEPVPNLVPDPIKMVKKLIRWNALARCVTPKTYTGGAIRLGGEFGFA